jgi:DNA polymerase III alpha subunit
MQDILKRTKPTSIEDLTALNAMYRPGPMQFINQFVESKIKTTQKQITTGEIGHFICNFLLNTKPIHFNKCNKFES